MTEKFCLVEKSQANYVDMETGATIVAKHRYELGQTTDGTAFIGSLEFTYARPEDVPDRPLGSYVIVEFPSVNAPSGS